MFTDAVSRCQTAAQTAFGTEANEENTETLPNLRSLRYLLFKPRNRGSIELTEIYQWLMQAGEVLLWILIILSCVVALVLSCLSLSGTWMVALASIGAMLLRSGDFPGWTTVIIFLLISVAVELLEWFAGAWGVTRRGGSGWAGFAAIIGGIVGLIAGTFIPLPVVGSLVGMLIGSFALAFVVEQHRLNHTGQAAHIARGAVIARILVILLKVVTTLGMIAFLAAGIVFD